MTRLLISALPNIIWEEFLGTLTIWLLWGKMHFLAFIILLGFVLSKGMRETKGLFWLW